MDKNRFLQLKKELAKYITARLNFITNPGEHPDQFKEDLKIVLKCINLTPEGAIIIDYGYMEGSGLDAEKLQPMIGKFFKSKGLKEPYSESTLTEITTPYDFHSVKKDIDDANTIFENIIDNIYERLQKGSSHEEIWKELLDGMKSVNTKLLEEKNKMINSIRKHQHDYEKF